MSLKINYLDKLNNSTKNIGIFVSKDTKITDFKGIFNENISKKESHLFDIKSSYRFHNVTNSLQMLKELQTT